MSDTPDLLPCPFCGGKANFNFSTEKAHNGTFTYWVECYGCQQCGKSSAWDEQHVARNQAKDYWNTRAPNVFEPKALDFRNDVTGYWPEIVYLTKDFRVHFGQYKKPGDMKYVPAQNITVSSAGEITEDGILRQAPWGQE